MWTNQQHNLSSFLTLNFMLEIFKGGEAFKIRLHKYQIWHTTHIVSPRAPSHFGSRAAKCSHILLCAVTLIPRGPWVYAQMIFADVPVSLLLRSDFMCRQEGELYSGSRATSQLYRAKRRHLSSKQFYGPSASLDCMCILLCREGGKNWGFNMSCNMSVQVSVTFICSIYI